MRRRTVCTTCEELLTQLSGATGRLFNLTFRDGANPREAFTGEEWTEIRYLRLECSALRQRLERHQARVHRDVRAAG